MDRRFWLGTLISSSALFGAAFGWWLRGPAAEAEVAPTPPVATEAPRRIAPPPRAPAPRSEAEHPPLPPLPAEAATASPHEVALRAVSELTGEGVVRCSVGDTVPDGPVAGISRGRVERGVLVGSVEDPEGQARIQLESDNKSDPPRLMVRWRGAWPGETGSCEALRPQRVAVKGTVVDARGRPVGPAEVGNLVDGVVRTGADGHFVAACWRGAECPLAARRSFGAGWGPFATLVPDGPVSDVVLVLDAPEQSLTIRGALEEWVAEGDRAEQQPDPLKMALADVDLPGDARRVIEGWLQDETAQRVLLRTALAEASVVSMR
jgi:hypothetical protein